jgi:omega-amidase
MQNLTVTLAQVNQLWEDKVANLNHFEEILESVKNSDIIVFPEMFHTGFSMNTTDLAENFENSKGLSWLKEQAVKHKIAIYTSLIIQSEKSTYNRGVFVYPTGEMEYYDKRKLFKLADEDKFYTAGNQAKIINYKGWKIQLQICYDLRFPEISRNFTDAQQQPAYDVLVYVANWPEKRITHWNSLLIARAIENQAYVIGVNRIGIDGKHFQYNGASQIIDANGNVVFLSNENQEFIENFVLESEKLAQIRKELPFLKDFNC